MSEEKKESPGFHMKGQINYEIELQEDQFTFRSQVSNENNLCSLLMVKDMMAYIEANQKNPSLKKQDKLNKQQMLNIITTRRTLEKYSEQLAAAIYEIEIKKANTPKLKVVTNEEFLKSKGIS